MVTAPSEQLTQRERQLVALLMDGCTTNADLAELLVVEPCTIKWHIINVFRKLNVSNRTELVAYAWRYGVSVDGAWYPRT